MIKSETLTIDTNVDGETVELSRAESGAVSLSIRNYDPDTDTFCERTTDIAKRELAALSEALAYWALLEAGMPPDASSAFAATTLAVASVERAFRESFAVPASEVKIICDGEHADPSCASLECWRRPKSIEAP